MLFEFVHKKEQRAASRGLGTVDAWKPQDGSILYGIIGMLQHQFISKYISSKSFFVFVQVSVL
jgi:hypothetical protein